MKEIREFRDNSEPAEYDQIHRALLSGLLSGVAMHDEGNHYRATRNRKVMIFPGSGLFKKTERKGKRKGAKPAAPEPKSPTAKFILCAEFMETTRLYARTVARIDPMWILRTGEHVLTHKYTDPVYDEKGERVMARERILLYGLEIAVRRTAYLKIDPKAATEIFIREALVEGRIRTRLAFHEANSELVEAAKEQRTRLRESSGWALDERLYSFYAERLKGVGSLGDLKAFIRDHHGGKDAFLRLTEADLKEASEAESQLTAFPDKADFAGIAIDLEYAYKPGEADDGATLKIPVEEFESVDASLIEWSVPGYISQRIEYLLRGLPKAIRKQLFPLADLSQELCLKVAPDKGPLIDQLTSLLQEIRGIHIRKDDWSTDAVPEYLLPRVELVDRKKRTVAAGRDWQEVARQYEEAVKARFKKGEGRGQLQIWKDGCARIERLDVRPDTLPELPEVISLGDIAGLPVKAWPGLELRDGRVNLRLYPDMDTAGKHTREGLPALCEQALGRELGWFERDLGKELKRVALGFAFMMDSAMLKEQTFALLKRHLLRCPQVLPVSRKTIEAVVSRARSEMKGLVPKTVDQLEAIQKKRDAVLELAGQNSPWQIEIDALVHKRFLNELELPRLAQYPRYMEALALRIRRARQNPVKDAEKAGPLIAFIRRYQALKAPLSIKRDLRWLLEEYKVQVFAQELGTDGKVSQKVIEAAFAEAETQAGRKA
jgi:ATP-dependent helicase HrpA